MEQFPFIQLNYEYDNLRFILLCFAYTVGMESGHDIARLAINMLCEKREWSSEQDFIKKKQQFIAK